MFAVNNPVHRNHRPSRHQSAAVSWGGPASVSVWATGLSQKPFLTVLVSQFLLVPLTHVGAIVFCICGVCTCVLYTVCIGLCVCPAVHNIIFGCVHKVPNVYYCLYIPVDPWIVCDRND